MIIHYNLEKDERKKLVSALGEILQCEPVYQKAPTYAYTVGNYVVDRTGNIICPSGTVKDTVNLLVELLAKAGFTMTELVGDNLVVTVPKETLTPDGLERLKQIVANKAPLLERAFKKEQVVVEEDEKTIRFPWFTVYGEATEARAYTDFIAALCKMAQEKKRVLVKPYDSDNDKFAMRLFLVQLNMKGDEHKESRKILMQYLTGNSAWRYGAKDSHPDKTIHADESISKQPDPTLPDSPEAPDNPEAPDRQEETVNPEEPNKEGEANDEKSDEDGGKDTAIVS